MPEVEAALLGFKIEEQLGHLPVVLGEKYFESHTQVDVIDCYLLPFEQFENSAHVMGRFVHPLGVG